SQGVFTGTIFREATLIRIMMPATYNDNDNKVINYLNRMTGDTKRNAKSKNSLKRQGKHVLREPLKTIEKRDRACINNTHTHTRTMHGHLHTNPTPIATPKVELLLTSISTTTQLRLQHQSLIYFRN
ncbi:unnamed protein product, partial [Laminaria digitata]